jgi:hypothetical protein
MTHIHQYEYREAEPRNSEIVRSRLEGRPRKTFETIDEAITWYEEWVNENPRPAASWGRDGEAVRKPSMIEFTRRTLEQGSEVVDGFWSGQYVSITLIPCPLRKIPGYPSDYPCPLGRAS